MITVMVQAFVVGCSGMISAVHQRKKANPGSWSERIYSRGKNVNHSGDELLCAFELRKCFQSIASVCFVDFFLGMEAIWYRSQWLHWSKWTEGKFSTALNQMLRSTDTCLFIWSYVTSNMQCLIYYKYCFNLLSYLFYAFFSLFSPYTHSFAHQPTQ